MKAHLAILATLLHLAASEPRARPQPRPQPEEFMVGENPEGFVGTGGTSDEVATPVTAGSSNQAGCKPDSDDVFNIVVDFDPKSAPAAQSNRDFLFARDTTSPSSSSLKSCTGTPVLALKAGILTDQLGRLCSIVSNHQFQCDPSPGQNTALQTSNWKVCANELKTSESMKNWYVCKTGDGTGKKWWNVYGETLKPGKSMAQCTEAKVEVRPCSNSTGTSKEGMEKRDGPLGGRALLSPEEEPIPIVKRDVLPVLQGRAPFPVERAGKMWWPMPRRQ